jgi:endonuclease-3
MFSLGHDKIYDYIKSCGLAPKKTKAIVETSEILIGQHNSKVPKDIKALEDLPGVGHKTASVVLNQAFGIETFPVDTHIHRLAQRWDLTNGKSVVQTEKDLKNLFDKSLWGKLHIQIILYGRQFCTARGCDGTICFMCTELFPKRKKKVITNKA